MLPNVTALFETALLAVAALFPIVNPIGSAPIFLSMTADLPGQSRRMLARKVAGNAFMLLIAAMLIGSHVLQFFGISLPIVRVGGGLLVTASGWRLLNADDDERTDRPPVTDAWEREVQRRAFYPITFPLTVGPGSISIAITLGARVPTSSAVINLLSDLFAVAVVAASVYLSYRFASRLIALLGETGTRVFMRLSAFMLLCVGVSIIWSGVLGLIQPLLR
ncbi:MAG TPA: MarC family protein [Vicinamibacterales bacterium]|jgi:multiple antibiotic resistance protein